jgi:type I restriction enzyme, S subunit
MKLSDLIDFNPKRPLEKGSTAPFIEMADLPEGEREVAQIGSRVFSGGGSKFSNGDTLFARITPCFENGKTAKVSGLPDELIGHGSTEFIVMAAKDKEHDEDFVYYLARHPEFRAFAKGRMEGTSGRQRVSWQALASYEIAEIDKTSRREIGSVLASLDNRIAANRRVNATIETIARTLFKDWFVDFGPVRAKMGGRQPPGVTPEIAAMFPDSLHEDGRPQGWDNATLGDIANLNPESWSKKAAPTDVEYVDLANTKWGTIESTTRFKWADAPSRAQRILRPGDTIVGTVRPGNGSYSYVSTEGLTGSTGFAVLRPKDNESRVLLYLAATSSENIERLSHLADGGAYPAVRPEVVLASPIALPNAGLVAEFSAVVSPLIKTIEQNKRELASLASLRDLLLPKLMSGEIRIGDVAQMTGVAG